MFRRISMISFATLALVAPAAAQDAGSVAGRPALATTTSQDLIAQREKWGSAPSAVKPAAAPAAPAAAAPGGTAAAKAGPPDSYAVLPTDDTGKLIAEREKWGKGPKGYEKKKVVSPRAAGAPKSFKSAAPAPAKAAPAKAAAKPAKAVRVKKTVKKRQTEN